MENQMTKQTLPAAQLSRNVQKWNDLSRRFHIISVVISPVHTRELSKNRPVSGDEDGCCRAH